MTPVEEVEDQQFLFRVSMPMALVDLNLATHLHPASVHPAYQVEVSLQLVAVSSKVAVKVEVSS